MKFITTFLLLITVLFAQAATNIGLNSTAPSQSCAFKTYTLEQQPQSMEKLKSLLAKNKRNKNVGLGMIITGSVLFVAGQVMMWTSFGLDMSGRTNYSSLGQDPLWDAGLGSTLVGVGGVAGGLPLYFISKRNMHTYRRRMEKQEQHLPDLIIQ